MKNLTQVANRIQNCNWSFNARKNSNELKFKEIHRAVETQSMPRQTLCLNISLKNSLFKSFEVCLQSFEAWRFTGSVDK